LEPDVKGSTKPYRRLHLFEPLSGDVENRSIVLWYVDKELSLKDPKVDMDEREM
jgi:hypothetical protein